MARLCREAAVLREQQRESEAAALEAGALHDLVSALRRDAVDPAAVDAQLAATVSAERDRVANAAVLAQLLAPQVAALLRSPSATPLAQPTAHDVRSTPAPAAATAIATPSAPPVPPPAPRRTAPGAIADFIDEMIALERVEPGPVRRAS